VYEFVKRLDTADRSFLALAKAKGECSDRSLPQIVTPTLKAKGQRNGVTEVKARAASQCSGEG